MIETNPVSRGRMTKCGVWVEDFDQTAFHDAPRDEKVAVMRLNRLLLSGVLKPTRTIMRREGVLLSVFAVTGALAYGYLLASALVAAVQAIIEWIA